MMRRRGSDIPEAVARYGEAPGDEERRMLRLVLKIFLVGFMVLLIRLAQLHLSPHHELTASEKLHFGEIILREPRGDIFDRNGMPLATTRKVPSLWVDPRLIKEPETTISQLSEWLNISPDEIRDKIDPLDAQNRARKFAWVDRWREDLDPGLLAEVEERKHTAVYVQYEPLRHYPQRETAAHLLGFVNRHGEAGDGLELRFNQYLHSTPGRKVARKDASRRLLESQTHVYVAPEGGDHVQLTIDTVIQHRLEQELDKRMEEVRAPRAMGIVMDPHTGAILALASRPAFDPNRYDEYDAAARTNRALVEVFEPGSAFKIVPAAAALEHGLITPQTIIDTEGGSFNPYGHRISDFHRFPRPEPFSKCFEQSSNVAIIKVAALLGEERMVDWVERFGFGRRTSRDFAMESPGIMRRPGSAHWSRLSMGSLPMGQEISVTMPQLARAFAVIANGGYLVEPYYVERAVSRFGEVTYQHAPEGRERVLSEQAARTMRNLCQQVVDKGTGRYAIMPEYTAGGKTGTAQIALPGGGGYSRDLYTAVFAGFAPATDPKLVSVIVVQEPGIRERWGGYVSGPVFKTVIRDALIRLNVPPDKELPEPAKLARAAAAPKALAPPAAADLKLIRADADTVVTRITVEEMESSMEALIEPLDGRQLLSRVTPDENKLGELPDLHGMSKREALSTLAELEVAWDVRGAGWVSQQDPPPGTPLSKVALCALEFSQEREEDREQTASL